MIDVEVLDEERSGCRREVPQRAGGV